MSSDWYKSYYSTSWSKVVDQPTIFYYYRWDSTTNYMESILYAFGGEKPTKEYFEEVTGEDYNLLMSCAMVDSITEQFKVNGVYEVNSETRAWRFKEPFSKQLQVVTLEELEAQIDGQLHST